MRDTILNVKTKTNFLFEPNKLLVKVLDVDIQNKQCLIYYELKETTISSQGRLNREWIDRGSMYISLDLISEVFDNGVLNQAVVNTILSQFNLELDTSQTEEEPL